MAQHWSETVDLQEPWGDGYTLCTRKHVEDYVFFNPANESLDEILKRCPACWELDQRRLAQGT